MADGDCYCHKYFSTDDWQQHRWVRELTILYIVCILMLRSYIGIFLEDAGITDTRTQMIINICINVFCLFCAFGGTALVEKLGRRPTLSLFLRLQLLWLTVKSGALL